MIPVKIAGISFITLLLFFNASLQADIHIAVASNFHATLKHLINDYSRHNSNKIIVSSASSGKIYAQILQGAPFDLFLSADSLRPERLEQQGLSLPDSRVTYASGQLVLWSNQTRFNEINPELLKATPKYRLAIANPRTAPYGLAAKQTLQKLGLWDDYQGYMVFGENISQTFQFVSSQNTALGLIALSQALHRPGKQDKFWQIPDDFYQPIKQQAIILKASSHIVEAKEFMQYIQGSAAKIIIQQQGYKITP